MADFKWSIQNGDLDKSKFENHFKATKHISFSWTDPFNSHGIREVSNHTQKYNGHSPSKIFSFQNKNFAYLSKCHTANSGPKTRSSSKLEPKSKWLDWVIKSLAAGKMNH